MQFLAVRSDRPVALEYRGKYVHKVDVECLQALQAVPPQSLDRRGELYQRGIESWLRGARSVRTTLTARGSSCRGYSQTEATEFLANVLVFDDRPLVTTGERPLCGDKQL